MQITYTVPFAVTAELTADSGGGQGIFEGLFNIFSWLLFLGSNLYINSCYGLGFMHLDRVGNWSPKSCNCCSPGTLSDKLQMPKFYLCS